MLAFNIPPFRDLGWELDIIKPFPMKVFHTFTFGTGQVLVGGHVRIKPGLVIKGRDSGHKPAILKGQQGPVNRIQRNGGYARLDPLVDGICGRMIVCRRQFSKDFKTLVGEF
jgi:hypothetical protein